MEWVARTLRIGVPFLRTINVEDPIILQENFNEKQPFDVVQ